MQNLLFEKEYEVNSFNIDINKRLCLYGLLGILQDTSSVHAEALGVGYESMTKNNSFWVLIQQKLVMHEWPKWQDTLVVQTSPRAPRGLKVDRDFKIYHNKRLIGESIITYMVLDGESRRPTTPKLPMGYEELLVASQTSLKTHKIVVPEDLPLVTQISVRNSDLDMNHHVNNTKYAQWILDTLPLDFHKTFWPKEFEINFIAETHLSDVIYIYSDYEMKGTQEGDYRFFKGVRQSDKKIVFTAALMCQQF